MSTAQKSSLLHLFVCFGVELGQQQTHQHVFPQYIITTQLSWHPTIALNFLLSLNGHIIQDIFTQEEWFGDPLHICTWYFMETSFKPFSETLSPGREIFSHTVLNLGENHNWNAAIHKREGSSFHITAHILIKKKKKEIREHHNYAKTMGTTQRLLGKLHTYEIQRTTKSHFRASKASRFEELAAETC